MGVNPLLVFRRELRGYFLSPIAYIVISAFLIVIGWFFFSPFFLEDRADLRKFFSLLPLILSFVTPAVTMRLFSEEYRGGTYEITRTLPISIFATIAGKFLAALTLMAFMLLPTVSYAIFVANMGDLDWGPVIGGYVGALLLSAAYTAIGLFASSLTKNQIVGYVVGIALAFFFPLIDRSLLFLPGNLAGFFQYLSADVHFQNVARGVFDVRDLIYFVTLTAFGLYASLLVLTRPSFRGQDRVTLGLMMGAHGSFIAFFVVLHLASAGFGARVDLTEDRIHSLSPVSRDTIAALREPVTVRAFFSSNLPAPFNNVEQSLRDLLGSFALKNPKNFNFAFHTMTKPEESLNSSTDENIGENEQLALQYTILPIQVQQVEADEIKLINAYMGVTVIYGDKAHTLGAVTSTEQLEYELITAIRKLTERSSALLSRDKPIKIDLYLSSVLDELSEDFRELRLAVRGFVDKLNPDYYNKLVFENYDPTSDTAALARARDLGLPALGIGRQDGTGGSDEVYVTIVIDDGREAARINLVRQGDQGFGIVDAGTLQRELEVNIDALLSTQLKIGYVVGKGNPPFRGFGNAPRDSVDVIPDLVNFHKVVTREYDIDGFYANNGVPDGLQAALLVGPREEFSDYELFQLDQYLMRGGSLVMFLDAFDLAVQGNASRYFLRQTGIEKLIEHYGVRLLPGQLLDERSYVVNEIQENGIAVQIPIYGAPDIGKSQLNQKFPFMRNIDNMVLLNISALELIEDLPEGVTAHSLISSSPDAWVIDDPRFADPLTAQPPSDELKSQYGIAYLLEGEFQSYFADRPLPSPIETVGSAGGEESAKNDNQYLLDDDLFSAYQDFLPRGSGGKLFVMGSSMTFNSSLIDAEGRSPVALFVQNTIDFMNGREGVAEMRAKGTRIRSLDETTPFIRALTKYVNIAGLPILVMIAGLIVWFLHRARRRRIYRMFAGDTRE